MDFPAPLGPVMRIFCARFHRGIRGFQAAGHDGPTGRFAFERGARRNVRPQIRRQLQGYRGRSMGFSSSRRRRSWALRTLLVAAFCHVPALKSNPILSPSRWRA